VFSLHVSDAEMMDVLEGTARGRVMAHVAGCAKCRGRLDEARGGLALAVPAEVPEPSPLFWDALRRRVSEGINATPAARPSRFALRPVLAGALVAAAAVAGVALLAPRTPVTPPTSVAAALPAWSALPEDDPNLEVLEGLETQVADAVPATAECHDWAQCVAGLDEDEGRALATALRSELAGEGAL
jgi:hypothetical protein